MSQPNPVVPESVEIGENLPGSAAQAAADADAAASVIAEEVAKEDAEDEEVPEEDFVETLPVADEDYDPALVLELGDRVFIQSTEYGQVWGTVYYRDNTLLRLRPDGAGNILYDFDRDYDPETRTDAFAEKLGVEFSYILKKADHPAFVLQQDFQVDQTLAGILPTGKAGPFYKITKINEEEDSIKMVNIEDPSEKIKVQFKFKGIPLSAPFRVLRIAAPPGVDLKEEQAKAKAAATAAAGVPIGAEPKAEEKEEEEEGEWDADLEVQADEEYDILEEGNVVLPQQRVIREAAASKIVIPENLQKSDAINDFLNMLDKEYRKDPKAIRERRILVETLYHMKREITEYKADGTVKGVKRPSVSTLFELLKRVDVPMGRAVLDIEKRLYTDIPPSNPSSEAESEESRYFMVEDAMAKPALKDKEDSGPVKALASSFVDTGKGTANQIIHYMNEQTTYEQHERPWKPGTSSGPSFEIRKDLLFFRSIIPNLADPELAGYMRSGPKDKETGEIPYPELGSLLYAVETALTTTWRKGSKGDKIPLLYDEAAPLNSYLLFPAQMAAFLGSKRSGSLALDVMRGKEAMMWISGILQVLGVIQEVNKVTHIVPLKVEGGNLAANIPLTDYLEGLLLPGMGIGDMLIDLGNYGLNHLEFTPEILAVLQAKLQVYQDQLTTTINILRKSINETPAVAPEPNPMLPLETTNVLDAFVREEPMLVASLKTFEAQNPVLQFSDIARVAYLLKYNGDFWQAVIGKQVALTTQERFRTIKTDKLEELHNKEVIKYNQANRGQPPKPNKCEHVAKLVTIRKLKDEEERYFALTGFLAYYKSDVRKDNWITCKVCNLELMCVHERLLIRAFVSPLERELVFKEINLHFSGGIFQGHYICRSCGQPIQEIDYDTGLQFDEKGRPMIGRAVLKDDTEGGFTAKDLATIFADPIQKSEDFEFADPEQMTYYRILRELAERVGIFMERTRYKKIIKYLRRFMDFYPDRETFNTDEKAYKKMYDRKNKEEIDAGRKKPYKIRSYDTIISKNTICAAAIMLLYEIQTHIPDYVPQYSLPGCDAGFGGYPLVEDKESRQGLTYMACAISSINREDEPWASAEFYKPVKSGKKEEQLAGIIKFMDPIAQDIEEKITSLEQLLVDKRVWKMEQLGVKGEVFLSKPKDSVPKTFLPELVLPTVAEAAAEPVREGALDARAVARAWIRNAHDLARKNSKPIRGSPYADITCCKIPISQPGSFWQKAADLSPVPLGGRVLQPSKRPPVQQFHFEARTQESLVIETSKDLTYRLFMKVCPTGERKGLPHEPGYTNLCHSCGFQFPTHPSIVDPDEAKTAITKQNIDTNMETFQDLLNTVHNNNTVKAFSLGGVEEWQTTMESIRDLAHEPMEDWAAIFRRTIRRLNRLKTEGEITVANVRVALSETKEGEVSLPDAVAEADEFVKAQFGKKIKWEKPEDLENRHRILDIIAELPWHNFVQVLETYFLKVSKNILFQYQSENLLLFKHPKLALSGINNIKDALTVDNSVLKAFGKEFNSSDKQLAQLKLAKFVMQLSDIIRLKNRIRPIYFVGGQETFKHIQGAFLYGPLKELFDSKMNPFDDKELATAGLPSYQRSKEEEEEEEEEEEASALVRRSRKKTPAKSITDTSITLLVRMINATIVNFKKYQLNFDDAHLREVLAERAEKEKQGFIAKSKTMSDEERALYRMQRRLGTGRFAKDVKSQVQGYDIEQINLEEEENEKAGIITRLDKPGDIDDPTAEGWREEAGNAERTEEDMEQAEGYGDNVEEGEFFGEEEVD